MSGLYIYENYLYGIRINGAELRKYMEHAASFYGTTPDYNYDMIQGVDYTIDLNQPVGHRITKLQYQGRDVKDTDSFTMAINDYRMNAAATWRPWAIRMAESRRSSLTPCANTAMTARCAHG